MAPQEKYGLGALSLDKFCKFFAGTAQAGGTVCCAAGAHAGGGSMPSIVRQALIATLGTVAAAGDLEGVGS